MTDGKDGDRSWPDPRTEATHRWELRLYVAGQTRRSVTAYTNLTRMCEENIPGQYTIEVIDVLADPVRAEEYDVIAIPTLVRIEPGPVHKIVGDLSNTARALSGLSIGPRSSREGPVHEGPTT